MHAIERRYGFLRSHFQYCTSIIMLHQLFVVFLSVCFLVLLLPAKSNDTNDTDCCICARPKSSAVLASDVECGHGDMHMHCLQAHFVIKQCTTCPICRHSFDPDSEVVVNKEIGLQEYCALQFPEVVKDVKAELKGIESVNPKRFYQIQTIVYSYFASVTIVDLHWQELLANETQALEASLLEKVWTSNYEIVQKLYLSLVLSHLPDVSAYVNHIDERIQARLVNASISERTGLYAEIQQEFYELNPLTMFAIYEHYERHCSTRRSFKPQFDILLAREYNWADLFQEIWLMVYVPKYTHRDGLRTLAKQIRRQMRSDVINGTTFESFQNKWGATFEKNPDIFCHMKAHIQADREARYYESIKICALWRHGRTSKESIEAVYQIFYQTFHARELEVKILAAIDQSNLPDAQGYPYPQLVNKILEEITDNIFTLDTRTYDFTVNFFEDYVWEFARENGELFEALGRVLKREFRSKYGKRALQELPYHFSSTYLIYYVSRQHVPALWRLRKDFKRQFRRLNGKPLAIQQAAYRKFRDMNPLLVEALIRTHRRKLPFNARAYHEKGVALLFTSADATGYSNYPKLRNYFDESMKKRMRQLKAQAEEQKQQFIQDISNRQYTHWIKLAESNPEAISTLMMVVKRKIKEIQ